MPRTRGARPAASAGLEEIYRGFGPLLYRRCRALLRDPHEARDVVQEVFVRGLSSPRDLEPGPALLGWLYVVATRLCWNRMRDGAVRARLLPPALPETGPEAALADRDLARRLLGAVDETTFAIATAVIVDEMTHDEAARMANVSPRTVRNRLTRFFAEVRKHASDEPPDAGRAAPDPR